MELQLLALGALRRVGCGYWSLFIRRQEVKTGPEGNLYLKSENHESNCGVSKVIIKSTLNVYL